MSERWVCCPALALTVGGLGRRLMPRRRARGGPGEGMLGWGGQVREFVPAPVSRGRPQHGQSVLMAINQKSGSAYGIFRLDI